jgi:rod shape-determining protein MreC
VNFLLKYGSFFLFLALEGYSLYLVAQYNKDQGEIAQSTINLFTGTVYNNFSGVAKYLTVQEMADSLANENAQLRTLIESSKYNNTLQSGVVRFPLDTSTIRPDTTHTKDVTQQFHYTSAEVINNSVARQENYLILNRGKDHGILPGMGVVSANGIVGIVKNVSPHYCQIMSLLHKQTSISAMVRRNRYFGSLTWKGGNPRLMSLENVPKHADIVKGDTILTSGYSEIFPGEMQIGIVSNFKVDNGSNFYNIEVTLNNDLSNLRYVYVIGNMMQSELKQLQADPVPIKNKNLRKTQLGN